MRLRLRRKRHQLNRLSVSMGCALEPDEWIDADSFRVRLPDSRLETFRLYFVDTTESRSRGKRSDEQAAYFGLTRAQAIELGRRAKMFTASSCTTVHDLHTLAERFRTNSLLCNRPNGRRSRLERIACQLRTGTNLWDSHAAARRSGLPRISRAPARSGK